MFILVGRLASLVFISSAWDWSASQEETPQLPRGILHTANSSPVKIIVEAGKFAKWFPNVILYSLNNCTYTHLLFIVMPYLPPQVYKLLFYISVFFKIFVCFHSSIFMCKLKMHIKAGWWKPTYCLHHRLTLTFPNSEVSEGRFSLHFKKYLQKDTSDYLYKLG